MLDPFPGAERHPDGFKDLPGKVTGTQGHGRDLRQVVLVDERVGAEVEQGLLDRPVGRTISRQP